MERRRRSRACRFRDFMARDDRTALASLSVRNQRGRNDTKGSVHGQSLLCRALGRKERRPLDCGPRLGAQSAAVPRFRTAREVTARHELLRSRNHPRDELDMRAIEPPAGLVASMREYRMNADLRLRLIV